MVEFIEVNYISPISNYKFDIQNNKYYLTIINSSLGNTVIINKIELPSINNINDNIRSYFVGKSIKIHSNQYPYLSILLFEHNIKTNIITLLFTGDVNLNNIEFNNIIKLHLFTPSNVLNTKRSSIYTNETDFLNEQFYNHETVIEQLKCILFITKLKHTDKSIINPYIYKFDIATQKFIYDRYHNNIIKEQPLVKIDELCNSNTFNDYLKLIKMYNIDVNRYLSKQKDTFKSMFMRQINTSFRKLQFDPYANNLISCSIDGRVSAFHIDETLKFKISGNEFKFNEIVSKPYELMNGNGFMIRTIPSDYQRICVPYAASLKEVGIFGGNDSLYYISLRFESNYFIPPNVHEREYISVVYGHAINDSRQYPELLDTQENGKLVYHLVLCGGNSPDTINFTNKKLLDIKQQINIGTRNRVKMGLFDQGEELGTFSCCFGNTIFMINRPIKFSSDISFYSKINNNNELHKQIETYVRQKDVIGLIM
ncbi:phosphatidylserine decarboxylase [Fadolivirus algeromassiliense]|jgi:hypothetical protein|uniref:Phosphatidylserine decarboxylase n=1 Tax=Fadolivirus FV1/VV64 TaxID=3070911 RepID=A0A7D3QUH1_9VIRU|nr:phosphatidylserine decarboxylase [Fadolivirus algeromassiliense]QKF94123.1 phosphatidylserine decarboxylase [Fadolivirus FV1/VV64]